MRRPWILLPLLAAACSPATAEDDDEVSVLAATAESVPDVPLEAYRFERSGAPLVECVRADQLRAGGEGMQNRWPLEARRSQIAARQGGEEWTSRELYFLDSRIRSRAVRWNDDLHFFFTTGGGPKPYQLVYADTQNGQPVVLDSLEPTHAGTEAIGVTFGAFDVAPLGDRLLVVYGTPSDAYGSPSSLRSVWGTSGPDGIEFSAPEVDFEGSRRVFDVQLLETEGGGRVDLVFQMGPQLAYSTLAEGAEFWTEPSVLSETAIPHSTSLAAEGQRIYVAWSDQRYESMEGWAPVNGRKLMLRHSTDGGASFSAPVRLGSKLQKADSVMWTLLAFLEDAPVVLGRGEGTGIWERYALEPDLSGYASLEPVSVPTLEAAYRARMRPLLERGD